MALVLKDRVKETSTTAGTGTITLAGAASGFQSFSAIGNGNSTYYAIVDPATGDWEVGIGTYTSSGTTLSRTTVLSSSTGGSLVPFAANTKDVFVTYPSEKGVWLDSSGVVSATSFGAITATSAALTSGTITTAPTNATDIVNKEYADSISSGLNYHQPVIYASTTTLPAYTYNNGSSGVGATITANANGALSLGGGSPTATQRVLIKDEAGGNAAYNGVYVVTQAGSAGTPFILTRATDYDTSGTGTNEIDQGDYVLVVSGTLASTAWVQQTPLPITVGTTALTFLQFNAPITYNAGTGLNLSPATTFNISNTGVTASTYGSASAVPVFAVNAQGQITSVTNTNIAINGSAVSGNISGQAGSVANSLTAGTYLTGTAYNGSAAQTWTVDATSANTASKVVARDASGNFSAGTITAALSGNATTATTATNVAGGAANQIVYNSSAGTTTFAAAPSASGQLLNWNGSAYSWVSPVPTTSGGTGLTSFTSGGVVYASSTSALTTGSALTFDGTNSRLGIQTSSPTSALQVGNGSITPAYTSGISIQHPYNPNINLLSPAGTGVSSNIIFGDDASNSLALFKYTNSSKELAFINQASGGYQRWSVGGSEQMRLTSTGLGIGTSSPAYKLDVTGVARVGGLRQSYETGLYTVDGALSNYSATNGVYLNGNAAGWLRLNGDGTNASYIQVNGASYTTLPNTIQFNTASAERMRLDSSGNLGLGVTPSAWATLKAFEMGSSVFFANNGGTTLYQGANAYYNAGWLYKTTAAASLYTQSAGVHQWSVAASGTAGTAVSFTQAMTLTAAGDLGIGTSSPDARLHVDKAVTGSGLATPISIFSGGAYSAGTTYGIGFHFADVASAACPVGLGYVIESSAGDTNGSLAFYTRSSTTLGTAPSERARITSTGAWSFGSSGTATGTSGQVLTSNGSGAAPSWQTSAAAAKGFAVGMSLVFGR